jgi:FG-GAP-like repeat
VRRPVDLKQFGIGPEFRVAFLDRDSEDDILTVGPGGENGQELVILLGNGDGTFQTQRLESIAPWKGYLLADFDSDGLPDIAVMGFDRVELFLNRSR